MGVIFGGMGGGFGGGAEEDETFLRVNLHQATHLKSIFGLKRIRIMALGMGMGYGGGMKKTEQMDDELQLSSDCIKGSYGLSATRLSI